MKGFAAMIVAALGVVAPACSSGGGTNSAGPDKTSTPSAGAIGLIIEVSGPLSTEGFGQIKLGSDAAARALGVTYEYSAPASLNNFVSDYTALIKQAIARRPAAMVIGNFIPSAFDPLIKQATSAGIPVVVYNSGQTTWNSDGALTYVGTSYATDGVAGANAALKAGVHHLLCVDQTTNPLVEQVCTVAKGVMQSAGGAYSQLNVPLDQIGNPAALTQDIQGYLASHSQIDGVYTAGGGFGVDAAKAVKNLGKTASIKVGGNEVVPTTLQDIKDGTISFEVATQPYLQGFDALQIAAQYAQYKIAPTTPVITSGAVIDKANINAELALEAKYPGLPG
jgi:simple sugar transport system substrate-binding protein